MGELNFRPTFFFILNRTTTLLDMRKIRTLIIAGIMMAGAMSAAAQKNNDLTDSYNYKRGVELISADTPDSQGALESFQKEISEHPKNGYAFFYMGAIYATDSLNGKALECASKAIDLLKKDKEWLAYSYRLRAKVYMDLGKDDLAKKDWEAGIKADRKSTDLLFDRAEYYYDKNQYDLADADYYAIIAIEPGSTTGYKGKGRNAIARKDYQKAVDLFSYCMNLDPNDSQPYSFRAEAYIGLKKYNEAADDIVKAISIDNSLKAFYLTKKFKGANKDLLLAKLRIEQVKDKNNSIWPYCQGVMYENSNEYPQAIKEYKIAYDIDANDAILYRIAFCYNENGEQNLALKYIDKAIAMDSTDIMYLVVKSNVLYELGDKAESLALCDKAVDLAPDRTYAYYARGFIKALYKDLDGAIEDFTTCLVIDTTYSSAYMNRGDMYRKKGNEAAAIADFKKSIALDTVYTSPYCLAQYSYLGLGNKAKAIEIQDSILAHSSDGSDLFNAACLYGNMGDNEKSMAYLKQALEKGFREFTRIKNDDNMGGLKNRDDFKALMQEYEQKAKQQEAKDMEAETAGTDTVGSTTSEQQTSEIPFTREAGGLYRVKCDINGLPLSFWLDTGASTVSLSDVEATFMMKNGYLSKNDVVGNANFLDANGNVSTGTVLNLRKVKFGDSELTNIKASVVNNQKAPLLLGQSILARLGTIEIDNTKEVIRIKHF